MKFEFALRVSPLVVAIAALGMAVGHASAAEPKWDEKYFNPKPAKDDVILPMPCDGAMAFRKVYVPVAGPLDDYAIQVGQESDDWGYIEQSRPAFIAGSFAGDAKKTSRYYLMAKYELNMMQYQALTKEACPTPTQALREPATGISWFDAMQASNLYNIWLRKNVPDALPREDKVAGFVRLPTEVEWEFAARGGLEVDKATFIDTRYPMPDELKSYEWFGGTQSANNKRQLVGLLKPNPLGLHDMLGNVDEMMLDSFRLNKLDRQHGQAGGFVVRGSHFRTKQEDIRTAARREESYYDENGALSRPTMGVRWVVAAPTLTSRERVGEIASTWKGLGHGAVSADGENADKGAMKQLNTLASSVEDKKIREQLKDLENKLRASNQEQEDARNQAIRASLNLGSFLCTKLKDDGVFVGMLRENYKTNCESATPDSTCGTRKLRLTDQENRLEKLTQYYASSLVDAAGLYGHTNLARQVPVMDEIFEKNSQLKGLRPYLATYWSQQQSYLKSKKLDLKSWLSGCVAIPNS